MLTDIHCEPRVASIVVGLSLYYVFDHFIFVLGLEQTVRLPYFAELDS